MAVVLVQAGIMIMKLLRCLAFIVAKFNSIISASPVRGVDIALSRDHVPYFKRNYIHGYTRPTIVPEALVDLLMKSKHDWKTSIAWMNV